MTFLGWIVFLVIALICGAIGSLFVGRSIGGFIVLTVVGLLGALLGDWLATSLGAPAVLVVVVEGRSIDLLWAIVGAAIIAAIVAFVQSSVAGRRNA
jgi:uncharacterized membrane protein YeaQ/YmgE (transglycosylase-associated protein family)